MQVRVLLQNAVTLSFVGIEWGWTANADEALNFGEVVRAIDYAISHGLGEVRVVIKSEDSRFDLRLPPVHSVA